MLQHIDFNAEIITVDRIAKEYGNVYEITIKKGDTLIHKEYEYLIIATGIFNSPNIPSITGLNTFKGGVTHSRSYRHGQSYSGKKVLILGGSMTGIEIASNISKYAEKVYHSFKQPFWVVSHYIGAEDNKLPTDFYYTR